ncbi:MAG: class I SAM-dependent methyltransferase [Actinomycetota bacterium]|nr:class I SAM-dependent methyltransferase [Actinomycetota bacterium]
MTDWGRGSYELTASQLVPVADQVIDSAEPVNGLRLLDIACGTGNASLIAARRGASVVGLDTSPRLLAVASERAAQEGLEIDWIEADMAELPFPEHSFDLVTSVFGTIFGDPHQIAAEIGRVLYPSGRLAISSWVREGPMERVGKLAQRHISAALSQGDGDVSVDPEPDEDLPGAASADPAGESFDWGDPEQLRELFAGHGISVHSEKHRMPFVSASPEAQNDEWFDHHPMWLATKKLIGEEAYAELRSESLSLLHEVNEDSSAMRFTSSWLRTNGSPV